MSESIYDAIFTTNVKLFHDEDEYYHIIYKIVNRINGKFYIGKHTTKNPYDNYMGSGKLIREAIKKYGKENFVKIILYCLATEDEAYHKEAEIVTEEFVSRKDTYNLTVGGEGFSTGENHPNFNKQLSIEIKCKLSKANIGKQRSEQTKRKISEAHKGKFTGENHPNYGKHLSDETKQKLSVAHKGLSHSNETKLKISESLKGSNNPRAKIILKIDLDGNIVSEYGYMKDCYIENKINYVTLCKYIKLQKPYKGYYYRFK